MDLDDEKHYRLEIQRLRIDLRKRDQTIRVFQEIADLVSQHASVETVLNAVAKHVQYLVQAETVLMPVLSKDKNFYTYRGGYGKHVDEIIGATLNIEFGVCGWVWRNKKAWCQDVLAELSDDDKTRWGKEMDTLIVVPLIGHHGFLGGISALNKSKGRKFDKEDFDMLTLFASQITHALENVNLVESLNNEIEEKKATEKLLSAAYEEANFANQAKNQFLSRMSHELRTPLHTIIGYCDDLMEEPAQESNSANHATVIKNAGHHMLSMVTDIIDFTQLEAGDIHLEVSSISLNELINNLYEQFNPIAKNKHLEFNKSLLNNDVVVISDPFKLKKILSNLLDNAIKFTHAEGEVSFTLAILSTVDKRVELEFRIKDSGIGISTEQQQRIFFPFSQVDESHMREYDGAGIGLSIVQKLVDKMGGELSIHSELGDGSEFIFTLWLDFK
jgi:signal transduction histidine kinase